MNLRTLFRQALNYYKRNGILQAIKHIPVKLRWTIFRKRDILYVCELVELNDEIVSLPDNTVVEKKTESDELKAEEFQSLCYDRDEKIFSQQLKERFHKGSVLWLIKHQGRTAGMFWTLKGTTIKPHYFCLTENDVHLYDGQIVRKCRGLGLFPAMTNYILLELKKEGLVRAYMETNIANTPAIRAFDKTHFKKTATARRFHVFGRGVTIWNKAC